MALIALGFLFTAVSCSDCLMSDLSRVKSGIQERIWETDENDCRVAIGTEGSGDITALVESLINAKH
jgi:hypothetical protein